MAEARAECDAARKVLARGEDPAERIKLDRVAATVAASNSFEAVADEWLSKVEKEGRSPVTMKKLRWLLGFINASIGKRPIASIGVAALVDDLVVGAKDALRQPAVAQELQHILLGLSPGLFDGIVTVEMLGGT